MSEFDLIAALRERLESSPPGARVRLGMGDDAAVTVPEGATATTVDAIVEGIHFERATAPPRSIGHKALATALSDLAATGAKSGEAYIVLGVPSGLGTDESLEIYEGIAALAERTGTAVLGGDVTRSDNMFLAVTAVGHLSSADAAVPRAGARPGDAVLVTGALGGAAAGYELLRERGVPDPPEADELRRRHLEPLPRLAEGAALARCGASAMIDISDGLGADAIHVSRSSGVELSIELDAVPVEAGVAAVAGSLGTDPLALATERGEDYELLACIDPEKVPEAVAALEQMGTPLTRIGTAAPGSGVVLREANGRVREPRGFDQLSQS
jgi:thiamine-monophosphate kinase